MFLLDDSYWQLKDAGDKDRGIFAKKDFMSGTVIGDYLGKIIRVKDEDRYSKGQHFYLMFYNKQASIYADPKTPGIHFINHACTPNTWMYTYRGHTLYFAIRHIFAGEEITVQYLLPPLDDDCDPCTHYCECRSIICSGTMHLTEKKRDIWNEFEDKESQKTQRERISFGRQLPQLSEYPKNIPDNPVYTLFGAAKKEAYVAENASLPTKPELRRLIRETGRTLVFPKLKLKVLGIDGNLVYSNNIS